MTDIAKIAEGLTEGMKSAVTYGFAPAFARGSKHGGEREWWDICQMVGKHRSFRNTIKPLIERGLATRDTGLCRLTEKGLAVRAHLEGER